MDLENYYSDVRYSTPKRKVLGNLSNGSPVSPMANLKLLTKVATGERLIGENEYVPESQCDYSDQTAPYGSTFKKQFGCGYIRRNKSLSFLCEKFLEFFPLEMGNEDPKLISIKHMAIELGVEKRRVYDIINIVESLDMARKFAKDSYFWHGNRNVPAKMASLNKYGADIGLHNLVKNVVGEKNVCDELTPFNLVAMDERRIGVLCQKFIMLLLACHGVCPLTLDVAFTVLVGSPEANKTKSRRLYDISNMLVALGVITRFKTETRNNSFRKPAFLYSGPCFTSDCNCSKCSLQIQSTDDQPSSFTVSNNTIVEKNTDDISPVRESRLEVTVQPTCSSDTWPDIKEPPAKKRLVFKKDANITFTPITNVIHKQFDLRSYKPLGQIVVRRSDVKLEPGSLYKAVTVDGTMQLVKMS